MLVAKSFDGCLNCLHGQLGLELIYRALLLLERYFYLDYLFLHYGLMLSSFLQVSKIFNKR